MGQDAGSWRDQVKEAAIGWVVRLAEPDCTPEDRAAFEAWRDADLRHEVAYEREAAVWDHFDRLRALKPAGVVRPDADLLAPQAPPKSAPVHRRPIWAMAASVAAAIGVSAVLVVNLTATTAYATAVGERRVVMLKDGSRLELNTDSRVEVRWRGGTREVRVVRGEVMVDAVKAARPFVVLADRTRLDVNGSEVSVRLKAGGAAVTVKDGTVDVAGAAALPAGAEAYYGPAGATVRRVTTAEVDRVLAWRQGALAFNGQSLSQAVDEFNRYNGQRLFITDDTIASLRVAGYFQSSDLPGFVQAVTEAFPVKAVQAEDGSIYLSRAG